MFYFDFIYVDHAHTETANFTTQPYRCICRVKAAVIGIVISMLNEL